MPTFRFKQVDVFTTVPLGGNPVAVVFDADSIPAADMQRIARWTNLSETTFLFASSRAEYRLRIFTPRGELPFAGHPTIGSAHAVREAGLIPVGQKAFSQECLSGLIPISVEAGGVLSARVPRPKTVSVGLDAEQLRRAAGNTPVSEPLLVDVGPHWIVAKVETVDQLYAVAIDPGLLAALSREIPATGLTIYTVKGNAEVHVRSFAPAEGIMEDPVCGSGNAAVGAHIKATGLNRTLGNTYTARQGAALGRDGRIEVRIDGEDVSIGGRCVTVVEGMITI